MTQTREIHALLYACTQEGCPLCRLVGESLHRYLDAWKYDRFTDIEMRQELRRTRGFCHAHTWQLVQMGATLPLAQAYRDIISDTVENLQRGKEENTRQPTKGLLSRLFENNSGQTLCPACRYKEQTEAHTVHTLRQALLDEAFYKQFAASHGLCLPHFHLACTAKLANTPGDWLTLLRQAQLECLQRLEADLGELIRKHDYRFKDEPRGPEMLSWKRAAGLVAGEKDSP